MTLIFEANKGVFFEVEFGYDTSYTDDSVGINVGINEIQAKMIER